MAKELVIERLLSLNAAQNFNEFFLPYGKIYNLWTRVQGVWLPTAFKNNQMAQLSFTPLDVFSSDPN